MPRDGLFGGATADAKNATRGRRRAYDDSEDEEAFDDVASFDDVDESRPLASLQIPFPNLKHLDLSAQTPRLTSRTYHPLALATLPRLETLSLARNKLSRPGVVERHPDEDEHDDGEGGATWRDTEDEGATCRDPRRAAAAGSATSTRGTFPALRLLDVGGNDIRDARAFAPLLSAASFPSLVDVRAHANPCAEAMLSFALRGTGIGPGRIAAAAAGRGFDARAMRAALAKARGTTLRCVLYTGPHTTPSAW